MDELTLQGLFENPEIIRKSYLQNYVVPRFVPTPEIYQLFASFIFKLQSIAEREMFYGILKQCFKYLDYNDTLLSLWSHVESLNLDIVDDFYLGDACYNLNDVSPRDNSLATAKRKLKDFFFSMILNLKKTMATVFEHIVKKNKYMIIHLIIFRRLQAFAYSYRGKPLFVYFVEEYFRALRSPIDMRRCLHLLTACWTRKGSNISTFLPIEAVKFLLNLIEKNRSDMSICKLATEALEQIFCPLPEFESVIVFDHRAPPHSYSNPEKFVQCMSELLEQCEKEDIRPVYNILEAACHQDSRIKKQVSKRKLMSSIEKKMLKHRAARTDSYQVNESYRIYDRNQYSDREKDSYAGEYFRPKNESRKNNDVKDRHNYSYRGATQADSLKINESDCFHHRNQNSLKRKRTSEVHGLMSIYKPCNQESLSILNESKTPTSEIESEPYFEESNLNDTDAITVSSTWPTSSSRLVTQTFLKSSVKSESEHSDYCMIIEEPAAKKPKTEPNVEEIFPFDLPSAVVLKEKCQKLNIGYNKEAYKFWGQIEFDKIVTVSDNIRTHEFKSPNIYACLSLFFTGKSDSCFFIQHAINSAYRDELSTSSSMTPAEIDQAFANTNVSDDLLEFIAKYLECRIGIYENGKLKKFGKWESEKTVSTLILSFTNQMFSVILDFSLQ